MAALVSAASEYLFYFAVSRHGYHQICSDGMLVPSSSLQTASSLSTTKITQSSRCGQVVVLDESHAHRANLARKVMVTTGIWKRMMQRVMSSSQSNIATARLLFSSFTWLASVRLTPM